MIIYQKPLLPSAEKIFPYLQRIDKARYYSNVGPLAIEYENRLAGLFHVPVVTSSSATSALTATIIALDLPPASLIACPSWTFSATPCSIIAAGHIPYFVDVLADSGEIDSDRIPLKKVKAIVAVAPFGAPTAMLWWENYSSENGIPVIFDAAAGFDSYSTYPLSQPDSIPVVVSTHATKLFGTGEGGFVATSNKSLLNKIRSISNFGISAPISGINAKMSEYHAAVGLASLDEWPEKRQQWMRVSREYRKALGVERDVDGADVSWLTASKEIRLNIPSKPIALKMKEAGVDVRTNVYGCHTQPAFIKYPRMDMNVTEELMNKTILLPLHCDMAKEDVIICITTLFKSMKESMI